MSGMETEKEYRNNEDVQEEKPAGQAEEKPADPVQDHASALKKKKRRILIAAGAAAAIVIAYFCYSGWMQLPWMQNKYFLVHGIPAKQQWVQDGDSYYYMDENGRMSEGLQTVDGNHYYFDEETGVMQTGWIEAGDKKQKMYFQPGSGKAATGWTDLDGNTYYFSDQGEMQTGWITVDDQKYYMDEKGCKCTGWQTVGEEEYYLGEDGSMQTGWVTVDDDTYLLDEEGHKCTGNQTVDGKDYFFDNEGVMRTGWSMSGGKRYYYAEDGSMKTGLITVGGEKFYLGEDGAVKPGWHEGDDGSFYVCSDGYVADPQDGTGNYGRLIVRSVGIDVWLNTGRSRDDYQSIVDEENSALVVEERRDLQPVIADRRSQGFNLSGITEGSSACVIYADGTVQEYVCTRATTGRNLGNDVVDGLNMSVWRQNAGGLCAYASAGTKDPAQVITVFWEPVKDETEDGQTTSQEETEDGEDSETSSEEDSGEDSEELEQ